MACLRCAGLMVREQFYDVLDNKGNDFIGYRCLVCGEILDPVISKNKRTNDRAQNDQIFPSRVGLMPLHSAVETV